VKQIEVIGISGKAGTGKDFIYTNYLAPLGYRRWALADHFKIWAVGKGAATYDEVFHTKPPHVRKALQQTGTEEGRNVYGEDVWCVAAKAWMEHLNITWGENKFCITDVRFPNEVVFIKNMGGKILRIEAPQREAVSTLSAEARTHISETALDEFPISEFSAIIRNDPDDAETVESQIKSALGQDALPHDYNEYMTVEDFFEGMYSKVRNILNKDIF
jgi:hypothetical protein